MNAPSTPHDLKLRVLEAASRVPSMTRPEARRRSLFGGLVASIALIAGLFIAGGPEHAQGRPLILTVTLALGCAMLALFATWAASTRIRWMTGHGRALLWLLTLGTPALLALWVSAFHGAYAPPFERLGVRCLLLTLALAPWPFAAMVAWRRTIEPNHPALLGAALGAASGAWAGLMVVLWCPLSEPLHVVRGHLAPFLILIALGALVGRRLFGLKST